MGRLGGGKEVGGPRMKLSVAVAGVLLLAGAALFFLDVGLIGWEPALLRAVNDPAKMYFHVVILPLTAAIFVYAFPSRRISEVLGPPGWRAAAIVTAVCLVLGNLFFTWGDSRSGFEERIAPPQCFKEAGVRDALLQVDTALRSQLKGQRGPGSFAGAFPSLQGRVDDPGGAWKAPESGADAVQQYASIERALLSEEAHASYAKDPDSLPRPSIFRHGNARVWWAGILTATGLAMPMVWFWTVVWYRGGPDWKQYKASLGGGSDKFVGAAALTLTLLATWVLLKIYSEWYSKFYSNNWSFQGELWVAFFAAAGALGLLWAVRSELSGTGVKLTTVAAGLVAASAAWGKFRPDSVDQVAERYRAMQPQQMALAHLVLLFVIGGVVFAWWQDTYAPEPAPVNDDDKPWDGD